MTLAQVFAKFLRTHTFFIEHLRRLLLNQKSFSGVARTLTNIKDGKRWRPLQQTSKTETFATNVKDGDLCNKHRQWRPLQKRFTAQSRYVLLPSSVSVKFPGFLHAPLSLTSFKILLPTFLKQFFSVLSASYPKPIKGMID